MGRGGRTSGRRAHWFTGEAERGDVVLTTRLKKITYRGVYSDYRLSLPDGQELSATLTQRPEVREGDEVRLGLRAEDIVVLEEDER